MENDKLTVTFTGLTEAQILTMGAMFERYKELVSHGMSRGVTLYVDGDGNFRPDITLEYDTTHELNNPVKEAAEKRDNYFDHDGVAWLVEED